MKPIDSDHFQLSTGRTFTANKGLIGLTPDQQSEIRVSERHGKPSTAAPAGLSNPVVGMP